MLLLQLFFYKVGKEARSLHSILTSLSFCYDSLQIKSTNNISRGSFYTVLADALVFANSIGDHLLNDNASKNCEGLECKQNICILFL